MKASLIQKIVYHGTGRGKAKAKIVGIKVGKIKGPKKTHAASTVMKTELIGTVEGNEQKAFTAELVVPELPASHTDVKAIEIHYVLKLAVRSAPLHYANTLMARSKTSENSFASHRTKSH